MGVHIKANNNKGQQYDMCCSSFNVLRNQIGRALAPREYDYWDVDRTDEHISDLLREAVGDSVYKFLSQEDCDGSLSHTECLEVLERIKKLKDDTSFKFYPDSFLTIDSLKSILEFCYSHRTKLVWKA